jgi:hypothetical protein
MGVVGREGGSADYQCPGVAIAGREAKSPGAAGCTRLLLGLVEHD